MPKVQNIITVIPDRFAGVEASAVDNAKLDPGLEGGVRRPTRGITLKKDTFASIRVIKANNTPITLIDAGAQSADSSTNPRKTDNYTNFILQGVQEERMEKSQILETFGEPFIFLYGERPRMITFSGVLINTFDFNWEAEWWYNYDNYLRGTKCVENDARVFMTFDETVVSGYILAASSSNTSQEPYTIPFQFQMFVTGYTNFSKLGDPNAFPGFEYNTGNNDQNTNIDQKLDLSPFRPTLIPDFGRLPPGQGQLAFNGQNVIMPTLENSLKASLAVVSNQWNSIRDTIVVASSATSDRLNGGGVQIPVGFAGSMEFDDIPVQLTDPTKMNYGVIQYSTFDQNIDEYVGAGDQYKTSQIRFDNIGAKSGDTVLTYDKDLVERATGIWKDPSVTGAKGIHGMSVDTQQLGPVANFLVKEEVGMQLVAMNQLHQVPTAASEAVRSGLARFANALPNPLTVAASLESKL